MPSFSSLRDDETWALAFYVVSLRYQSGGAEAVRNAPMDLAIAAGADILDTAVQDGEWSRSISTHCSAEPLRVPIIGGGGDPMKVITTIVTKTETFDVHFEIEDEATAQAKLAQMLQDIQKRFCARSDSKKPSATSAPKPVRESVQPTTPSAK